MSNLEVLLIQGSTITVPEFKRNAEDGMVAPTGIDLCNSLVIGLKMNLDMMTTGLISFDRHKTFQSLI